MKSSLFRPLVFSYCVNYSHKMLATNNEISRLKDFLTKKKALSFLADFPIEYLQNVIPFYSKAQELANESLEKDKQELLQTKGEEYFQGYASSFTPSYVFGYLSTHLKLFESATLSGDKEIIECFEELSILYNYSYQAYLMNYFHEELLVNAINLQTNPQNYTPWYRINEISGAKTLSETIASECDPNFSFIASFSSETQMLLWENYSNDYSKGCKLFEDIFPDKIGSYYGYYQKKHAKIYATIELWKQLQGLIEAIVYQYPCDNWKNEDIAILRKVLQNIREEYWNSKTKNIH